MAHGQPLLVSCWPLAFLPTRAHCWLVVTWDLQVLPHADPHQDLLTRISWKSPVGSALISTDPAPSLSDGHGRVGACEHHSQGAASREQQGREPSKLENQGQKQGEMRTGGWKQGGGWAGRNPGLRDPLCRGFASAPRIHREQSVPEPRCIATWAIWRMVIELIK